MEKEELIPLGFKPIPHFTVTDSYTYDLGRERYLSIGDAGTPNEMMWIYQVARNKPDSMTDLICLHNWDYDGPLTKEKVISLINLLNETKSTKS